MKKFLALLGAVVMALGAFALVGCGGRESKGPSSYGDATFDEESGELYIESKTGKTPIKVTYSPGNGNEWIRKQASKFLSAEEGKNYYFVLRPDGEATSSMSSKLESNSNLDDIYLLLASPWQSYAALDQLENLDDLYNMTVPGESKTVGEKITGSWKTYGQAVNKGETHNYIFPMATTVTGFVYNKTLFEEYGWSVPQTVEDLTALCAKIVEDTGGKIAPFVYPGTVSGGYWDFIGTNWWLQVSGKDKMDEFMRFESADVFNPDAVSSPSYGKYTMLETFENLIVKNRKEYTANRSASYDHYQAQQAFGARAAAMIPNGSWIMNESGEDIDDEIAMMPVPLMADAKKDSDGEYYTYNYSGQPDFLLIPKIAENKTGAKLFLAYMCRDDMLIDYTNTTGTPRPFDYDLSKCTEVNAFQRSCLDIFMNSATWFEASTSPLWTGLKVKKFNAGSPYTQLIAQYPKVTADSWCASEYSGVKGAWPGWMTSIG